MRDGVKPYHGLRSPHHEAAVKRFSGICGDRPCLLHPIEKMKKKNACILIGGLISLFALGESVVRLTELKVAYATQGG